MIRRRDRWEPSTEPQLTQVKLHAEGGRSMGRPGQQSRLMSSISGIHTPGFVCARMWDGCKLLVVLWSTESIDTLVQAAPFESREEPWPYQRLWRRVAPPLYSTLTGQTDARRNSCVCRSRGFVTDRCGANNSSTRLSWFIWFQMWNKKLELRLRNMSALSVSSRLCLKTRRRMQSKGSHELKVLKVSKLFQNNSLIISLLVVWSMSITHSRVFVATVHVKWQL